MNYNIMVLLCFFADICRASFDHLSKAKEINNATFEVDLFRRQLSSQNQEAMLEGSYESTPPIFNHPFCNQMINSRKLCTEAEYSASVENNVHPVAQPLKILPEQIKAYDQTNRNATIQYYFVNGEPSTYGNYFTINPRTGAVFQTKPIARHSDLKKFVILVLAAKLGFKSLFSTAKLIIDVLDDDAGALAAFPRNKPFVLEPGAFQVTLPGGQKNLYPPVLQVTGVKGYIEENAKVGSIVRIGENFDSRPMQILVTDQDLISGMPPATYQYVLTGQGASFFAINQAGYIYVNVPNLIESEPLRNVVLNIQAREVNTVPVRSSQIVTLNITILPVASRTVVLHSPKFSSLNYRVGAAADVPFQNILKIKAVGDDLKSKYDGKFNYNILSVSNRGFDLFSYDPILNMLQAVKPLPPLEKYTIELEARDEGSDKTARTNINVEVSPVDDAKLTNSFRVTTETIPRLFLPESITTDFDSSNSRLFKFDRNRLNSWPNQAVFNVTISELVPVNSVVASFKTLGSINSRFSILSGNEEQFFRLDPFSGVLYTAKRFDHTNVTEIVLVISASNLRSNTSMLLNAKILKFVKSSAARTTTTTTSSPLFLQTEIHQVKNSNFGRQDNGDDIRILNEDPVRFQITDLPAYFYVGQILAENNEHGSLSFHLRPLHRLFTIGPRDGVIKTRAKISSTSDGSVHLLNVVVSKTPEQFVQLPVTIEVTPSKENEFETITTTKIDYYTTTTPIMDRDTLSQDDNFVFLINFYNISVAENSGPKELLRLQATNRQGIYPIYKMMKGDKNLFNVHPKSGLLTTLADLDAEDQPSKTLIIGAKSEDSKIDNLNATATVIINIMDMNDWTPIFTPDRYYFAVSDDFVPGTPIYRLQAFDKDRSAPNNVVQYYLHKNDNMYHEFFNIDPHTGLLSVARDLRLLDSSEFELIVEARDNGQPSLSSTALVTMTVVKKATTTQLPEVITMTTGQSSTTDELSGLTNNDESTIKFSHKSSSVTIPEDADVDYLVQILPVENKPPKHDSVYCNIVGGNVQDAFVIYTNAAGNCEIRVRYPNILDRETSENHILNVTVGFPDSQSSGMHAYDYTLLTVTLSDVNDNAPRFLYPDLESERQRTYFGVLDLHAKEFTTAVKVKAVDEDAGQNAQVSYSIEPVDIDNESLFKVHGEDWKYFTISEDTGEVKNIRILADLAENRGVESAPLLRISNGRLFHFTVRAQDNPPDSLNDQKSDVTQVKINIITNANRFAMLLDGILPEQAQKYVAEIKKSLHNRTKPCDIIGIDSIRNGGKISRNNDQSLSTELTFYAINQETGFICHRDQFSALFDSETIDQVRGELDAYFRVESLSPSTSATNANKKSHFSPSSSGGRSSVEFPSSSWGAAEIGFIALAGLIGVGSLVALIFGCCLRSKYGNPAPKTKRLIDADKMRLYGIMPERYNDTVTCSDKEYETQHDMLQVTRMSMSDDNNRHSRLTNNADFSIDEIGGIYTIQQPQHLPSQNNVSPRTDMLSRPKLQSRIYIPPPDYPPNVSSKKVGDKRETLTIL